MLERRTVSREEIMNYEYDSFLAEFDHISRTTWYEIEYIWKLMTERQHEITITRQALYVVGNILQGAFGVVCFPWIVGLWLLLMPSRIYRMLKKAVQD